MKTTHHLLLFCNILALSTALSHEQPLKRTALDYDLCRTDCTLSGVPMPDKNTILLPLNDLNPLNACPITIAGSYTAPNATSTACLAFSGTDLMFTFNPFPGYTIQRATVSWKLRGNTLDETSQTPPPPPGAREVACKPAEKDKDLPAGSFVCRLPFASVLGVSRDTGTVNQLLGMCPNGDREAMGFYLKFTGEVRADGNGGGSGAVLPFRQQYPCAKRDEGGVCTEWATVHDYFGAMYGCARCTQATACGA